MTRRIIPLYPAAETLSRPDPAPVFPLQTEVKDKLGRPLRDLRISVTDRCNLRCIYCMPKRVFGKTFSFIPHDEMLSFEEIARLAALFVRLGVEKIRLTGGEPLLRRNIEGLIEQLAQLETPDGRQIDLAMTTNGTLLRHKARALFAAGLKRLTVSLDAVDDAIFRQMNDVDMPVSQVVDGMEAASAAGFTQIKVNAVIKKGINCNQVLPIARQFRDTNVIPRFIEFMDAGNTNGWQSDQIVCSDEIIRQIHAEMPLTRLTPQYKGETASRWAYQDGGGEIGVIASVTQAFCGECTRLRLSTTGQLYNCLFAASGFNLKALLRDGWTDAELAQVLKIHWEKREDHYSELRGNQPAQATKPEMSYIGG